MYVLVAFFCVFFVLPYSCCCCCALLCLVVADTTTLRQHFARLVSLEGVLRKEPRIGFPRLSHVSVQKREQILQHKRTRPREQVPRQPRQPGLQLRRRRLRRGRKVGEDRVQRLQRLQQRHEPRQERVVRHRRLRARGAVTGVADARPQRKPRTLRVPDLRAVRLRPRVVGVRLRKLAQQPLPRRVRALLNVREARGHPRRVAQEPLLPEGVLVCRQQVRQVLAVLRLRRHAADRRVRPVVRPHLARHAHLRRELCGRLHRLRHHLHQPQRAPQQRRRVRRRARSRARVGEGDRELGQLQLLHGAAEDLLLQLRRTAGVHRRVPRQHHRVWRRQERDALLQLPGALLVQRERRGLVALRVSADGLLRKRQRLHDVGLQEVSAGVPHPSCLGGNATTPPPHLPYTSNEVQIL
eukprot:Rhum_TRINITY_DN15863_c0_g1::Rhum_TRINITY_DN15863_c0_g1_i1::g.162309::m.162309